MKPLYILGSGTMAGALGCGLKDNYEVFIVGRNPKKLAEFKQKGFQTLLYDEFNAENKDLILAFKPYALDEVAQRLTDKARVIISVLANKDFTHLQAAFKAQNFVLAMPNTAAFYKASTTPFVCENENHKDEILAILQAFGRAFELENARLMSAAMAISGCAPAFLAVVAESITNGGVYEGLKGELSLKLTQSLFESFTQLLKHEHPAIIKEKICSPGGVTIKGVKILEDNAVRSAFYQAINASATR